ncbi:MAG: hypothetical protein JXQ90_13315 [Cyclobacteriaceae bacterium]
MTRAQWVLIFGGILLVIGLYQLPRVVVENEVDSEVESHAFEVSDEDATAIRSLKEIISGLEKEKYVNFADSLARYYIRYGLMDSAVAIADRYLERDSSLQTMTKAGAVFYSAFERSVEAEAAGRNAVKAKSVLSKVVEKNPSDLESKNMLAMTMVATETPMTGIMMLREIVAEDPSNRTAKLNLGLLSIQSSQYNRAVGRFKDLLETDSLDYEAMLYLGVTYQEMNNADSANLLFEKIMIAEGVDPAIAVAAEQYLNEN